MSNAGGILVAFHFHGPVERRDALAWSYLVGTADWINHAILTYKELVEGVRELVAHGLLQERNQSIGLTRKARATFARAYGGRKRMSVFKVWAAADALIATQEAGVTRWRPVSRARFARAVQLYQDRMCQALRQAAAAGAGVAARKIADGKGLTREPAVVRLRARKP